jgi:hypothetical protein
MTNSLSKFSRLLNKFNYFVVLLVVVQFSIYSEDTVESNKDYLNGNKNYVDEKRDSLHNSEKQAKK